jgi:cob(I)alamin adenosyltransferase
MSKPEGKSETRGFSRILGFASGSSFVIRHSSFVIPLMSIATKTGDKGTTGLMFGHRVPKTDLRIEANGSVDELNAALGMVRATVQDAFITDPIFSIQKELVILMGEIAVADEDRERYAKGGYEFVTATMVDRLTAIIDDLEKNHKISFKHWATPGATLGSAALDVARGVCRRAERRVIELRGKIETVNPEIIRYLNRLSDLCWLYARFIETKIETL